LRATINAAIITTIAAPHSHPDCRALLFQIGALQPRYTQVATTTIAKTQSPLDRLALEVVPPA
jgi:hypothetical protein